MSVAMDELSKKHGRRFAVHTVQHGETLSKIASQYNIRVPLIEKYNPIIKDPGHIEAGWELILPDDRSGRQKYASHQVVAGDTLGKIAKKFHTTVEAILDINPAITNPNLIRPGSVYRVPDNR